MSSYLHMEFALCLRFVLAQEHSLNSIMIPSLTQVHKDVPYVKKVGCEEHRVDYVPGDSNTYLFGGNSNWRGPVWLCGECCIMCTILVLCNQNTRVSVCVCMCVYMSLCV